MAQSVIFSICKVILSSAIGCFAQHQNISPILGFKLYSFVFTYFVIIPHCFQQLLEQLEVTLSFINSLHNSHSYIFTVLLFFFLLLHLEGPLLHSSTTFWLKNKSIATSMFHHLYSVSGYMPVARDTLRIYNLYRSTNSPATPSSSRPRVLASRKSGALLQSDSI